MKSHGRRPTEPLGEAALYEYAVKALGRRMRTVQEIERLLRGRVESGEPGEAKIFAVLARLKERRYLDDSVYAMTYARLRREEGFGRLRIERDMSRRGISTDDSQAALEAACADSDEEQLARRFLARKHLSEPRTPTETARVMRRLISAGFSWSIVTRVMKTWHIDVDETDLPAPE